ncbi:hypothetical protein KQY30_12335 [Streptomyces sp. GMY02]|uniref:hypothetical protein n=1 Tax=Streptomyces sp. GMY02 TaxID=1333528 RepID=UPI001C2C0B64|nr:hypothetical protein [Streptomyces sp. GMY02]QXE34944.1 hypothetical protein KQY30_12335 [Streptomyces sp. GMY02]
MTTTRTHTAGTPGMSRRVVLAATAAALALGLTGACGGEDAPAKGEGPKAPATATDPAPAAGKPSPEPTPRPGLTGVGASDGRVLGQGELDRAVLATGDVSGFTAEPMAGPPPGARAPGRPSAGPSPP